MRSLFLFGAIALGGLLPQGHHYAFLIRHLLMVILFLSLLDLKLDRKIALSPRLGTIVAMMMALSGLAAWIGHWFSPELALVGVLLVLFFFSCLCVGLCCKFIGRRGSVSPRGGGRRRARGHRDGRPQAGSYPGPSVWVGVHIFRSTSLVLLAEMTLPCRDR
jgi:hypothetical protein